ncbi:hypothetical protein EVAR_55870_1 [Eumeta japonica]|uniref:Ig-like domain-containing protein n=1 Tax=Eumeta variegata TaxID=151549 RepID=A0A4C1Z163_EUMVA|nr:hypothetical protein EVAR_55870_1 [Eumeta japonica]
MYLGVSSLKDVHLDVYPSPVVRGGTAALMCHRDMQGAGLYSVKWYRGNHEFYRYTPLENPSTRVFGLPGIYVDINNSNGTQVLLKRLDLSLAGTFSCEVTAESPYFSTQIAAKYIDVISTPDSPPVLKADKEKYSPGEILRANCSSSPARPAANLTIFINDEPGIIHYELLSSGKIFNSDLYCLQLMRLKQEGEKQRPELINRKGVDFIMIAPDHTRLWPLRKYSESLIRSSETSLHPYENGLVWASVSAEVPISQELFPGGRLRVSCLASIYDVYSNTTKLDFFTPEVDPRPERITLTGDGSSAMKFQNWLLLLFLLFLPMLTTAQDSVLWSPDYVEYSFDYLDVDAEENLKMSLIGG